MIDLTMTSDEIGTARGAEESEARRRSRLRALVDPSSHIPTYVGIVVTLLGFALIAVAWSQVAGETEVWKQMPFLLSAGFPGLGLVMTGLLIINIAAKRQDAAERVRQLETLTEALHDLRRSLDEQ